VADGATAARRRVVLGIGNLERGDDAAGRAVVALLRRTLPDDVEVVEHDGEATTLLASLAGAAEAFIVDACNSGASAGTTHRIDVANAPLPSSSFGLSTHGFGLGAAIELARVLGELPPRCVVYAIEGQCYAAGAPLSDAVGSAVVAVAAQLRAELLCDVVNGGNRHA
jgi:hydrogenase maturation protease